MSGRADEPSPKRVTAADWPTNALPPQRVTLSLNRRYSLQEIQRLQRGLVPEEMEDKWFIYWENDTLNFHRSWTGNCIYRVRFVPDGDAYRMIAAEVNRDPEQYRETDDEMDARLIVYLIDVLLLGRSADFPSTEPDEQTRALKKWSQIGRAMLGQHPRQ